MLRAANRVLKPGAPIALFVVAIADALLPEDKERAIEAGPEHVNARPGYPELMSRSGFTDVEIEDVTDAYAERLRTSIRVREGMSAELEDLLGAGEYAEGQKSRRLEFEATQDGLLKRHLITAVRP